VSRFTISSGLNMVVDGWMDGFGCLPAFYRTVRTRTLLVPNGMESINQSNAASCNWVGRSLDISARRTVTDGWQCVVVIGILR